MASPNLFLSRPKKILALKLRSMGDTMLLSASLDALKEAYPETQIHVAVATPWAPLFIHHPAVSRIWPVDRHQDKIARGKAIARAALALRKEGFDAVLNFHASPSSATLAFATGARVRAIHFHSGNSKNRYSTLEIPDRGAIKTILEKDLDTVRSLGVSVDSTKYQTSIHLKPSEKNEAFQLLEGMGLKRPILALGLGATRPTKHWGEERFAELAMGWTAKTSGGVLLLTGPGEESRAQEILKRLGQAGGSARTAHLHNAPLRMLASCLSQCALYAGNDCGPKHVAAAAGVPTVTLFGPESPDQWHHYSRERHPYFYQPDLACRKDALPGMPAWCLLQSCEIEKHKCMQGIAASSVLETCLKWST